MPDALGMASGIAMLPWGWRPTMHLPVLCDKRRDALKLRAYAPELPTSAILSPTAYALHNLQALADVRMHWQTYAQMLSCAFADLRACAPTRVLAAAAGVGEGRERGVTVHPLVWRHLLRAQVF